MSVVYLKNGYAFNRFDSLEGHGTDSVFQRWLQHPARDDFWQKTVPTKEEYAKINIPILTMTGYFDDDQQGALNYYNLHNRYGNPEYVKNHYLFIGPFDHGGSQGFPVSRLSPFDIDSAALVSQLKIIKGWYNYTLKDAEKPGFLKDRITVFAMGENKWHYFNTVKNMSRPQRFYLSNSSNRNNQRFSLSSKTGQTKSQPLSLTFDTRDHSDDTLHVFSNDNGMVSIDVFKKKNILLFQSEVFKGSFILNGIIKAHLNISLSAPDADVLITWWEEDSSGERWPISNTYQRLSYSSDVSKRQLLERGKIYPFIFENSYWMCKQIKAGSRLLMTVSSLTNAQHEKNYGAPGIVSEQTLADGKQISMKIYHDKQYKSYIDVPVMTAH